MSVWFVSKLYLHLAGCAPFYLMYTFIPFSLLALLSFYLSLILFVLSFFCILVCLVAFRRVLWMVDFLRKICLPYFLLEFVRLFVRHKSHPLHNSTNVNHIEQKFRAHVQPALFKVQVTIVEQRSDNFPLNISRTLWRILNILPQMLTAILGWKSLVIICFR